MSLVEPPRSDGKYGLGICAFELGCAAGRTWRELSSQRHLQRLTMETGESAFPATADGKDTVLLDTAMSPGITAFSPLWAPGSPFDDTLMIIHPCSILDEHTTGNAA